VQKAVSFVSGSSNSLNTAENNIEQLKEEVKKNAVIPHFEFSL